MQKRMLDILVCPFDKESTLELFELKTKNDDENVQADIKDSNLSGFKTKELTNSENQIPGNNSTTSNTSLPKVDEKNNKDNFILNNNSDNDEVIEEGILFCNNCSRFYPIVEEIPIILPDELRDKDKDIEMLNKWSNSLPDKIIKNALPWHL
jgi:uncharacterized protein YbaR (Trm112 family)